jgi:hypothetical protein
MERLACSASRHVWQLASPAWSAVLVLCVFGHCGECVTTKSNSEATSSPNSTILDVPVALAVRCATSTLRLLWGVRVGVTRDTARFSSTTGAFLFLIPRVKDSTSTATIKRSRYGGTKSQNQDPTMTMSMLKWLEPSELLTKV